MNTNTYSISFDTLIEKNPHIACCRDLQKTIMNLLFFATGVLFLFISNKMLPTGNDAKFILSTLGVCMAAISIVYLVHGGKSYRYLPLGSRMRRGTRFFSRTAEEYFTQLSEEDGEDSWPTPIEDKNGGIRVEYIYDDTAGYLLLLPSIYEDLTYRPLRSGLCVKGARARELSELLDLN